MISFKDFLLLTKFTLSFVVSLSLLFGFILSKNTLTFDVINPFIAVLLLALGVSALNQWQEYKEDALMARTKNRPIASGRLSPNSALFISLILIFTSFFFIYLSLAFLGIILFTSVVLLYNLFYTKAKKITIYAAVYGAILGIIPPLIGWLSAGGKITDIGFIALGLFYFIWQIPHFWLLTLKYHKEYETASFPTVVKYFGISVVERITFIWLLLTLIAGMFLTLVFISNSIIVITLLVLVNIYTLIIVFKLRVTHNYIHTFVNINSYMLAIMSILVIDSLLYA
jgi:protoheme IX farnesyltransferase